MQLARVIGTCVATARTPGLSQERMLVLQPLDFAQRESGRPVIAVDTVSADRGQVVWFVRSREAANSLSDPFNPVDCAVVGILDELQMHEGRSPSKNAGRGRPGGGG